MTGFDELNGNLCRLSKHLKSIVEFDQVVWGKRDRNGLGDVNNMLKLKTENLNSSGVY